MAKRLSPWMILLIVVVVPSFLGLRVLSASEMVVGILEQREAASTESRRPYPNYGFGVTVVPLWGGRARLGSEVLCSLAVCCSTS